MIIISHLVPLAVQMSCVSISHRPFERHRRLRFVFVGSIHEYQVPWRRDCHRVSSVRHCSFDWDFNSAAEIKGK